MTGRTQYKYHPLTEASTIRLLSITSTPTGSVSFSLTAHNLRYLPHYEAISYTWGPPGTNTSIFCDGAHLPITPSCATMLEYLREPGKTRLVWIDQICINQKDTPERNYQVTLMTKIYSKAARVVVWIGVCDTLEARRCLELVGKYNKDRAILAIAKRRTAEWEQADPVGFDITTLMGDFDDIDPWLEDDGWARRTLEAVLRRPYFLRVWILQEVAVARKITLVCSDVSFDLQKLFQVVGLMQSLTPGDLLYPWNAVFCLNIFREDYAANGTVDVGEAFMRPFARTRTCQATDKRDKVYALRGICKDLEAYTPLPNYDKSEVEVFIEAARASLVADKGRLSMLSYGTSVREEPLTGLPSWCPDFGGPVVQTGVAAHSTRLWEKAKNDKRKPMIEGKKLFVRGKIVDTIAHVTDISKWEDENAPRHEQEFATWHAWYDLLRTATSSYGKEPIEMAFWRTMFNDSEEWLTPHSAKVNEEAAHWMQYVHSLHSRFIQNDTSDPPKQAGWDDWTLVKKNVEDAKKYTRNKRACATKGKYFGLLLPSSRVGDVVAYLEGASILHLLRPGQGKSTYSVVGPCYVHGLMNGERYPWKGIGLSKLTLA